MTRLHTFILHVFVIILLPIATDYSLQAQSKEVSDSVKIAFLPALGFNSDLGLIGGGLVSRYHYKEGHQPFYSYTNFTALASTKGLFQGSVIWDKPNAFETDIRLSTETYISRFLQNQFYGIGNYRKLPGSSDSEYYLFKSFSAGTEILIRKPIYISQNGQHFDVLGLIAFDYETPFGNESDRLIEEQRPLGYGGAITSGLGAGFVWESRNNEFIPTSGTYLKAATEFGRQAWGSTYNYWSLEADGRFYQSFFLFREITFANRLFFHHTEGEVPYWKLAELGGDDTMRGYPANRFADDNTLYLNSELRTWLWEFPEYATRLGGTLFMDIGRTYPNSTPLGDLLNDLRYTFGFGVNTSFFTEDFLLRADVGFSDEGVGIYFTAGYMF